DPNGEIPPSRCSDPVDFVVSGEDGQDSFHIDLTNENSSVPASNTGEVKGSIPGTKAVVYKGSSLDTGWLFPADFSGVTGTIDSASGEVTINTMPSDSGLVTISATKSGSPTLVAIYTLTKVRAGNAGEDAVVFFIVPSEDAVKVNNQGIITPTSISCEKFKRVGANSHQITTE